MGEVSYYSALSVSAVLDGVGVKGFWDGDDVVQVEQGADVGTMMIGAAGSGLFSQSADQSARITLRLQHTSPTHAQLTRRWLLQRQNNGKQGFPFMVNDRDSNEGGAADRCFIQAAPTDAKGKVAAVREWVLVTASWQPLVPVAQT